LFLADEDAALRLAHAYLIYVGLTLFLLALMLIFRDVPQGLGERAAPTLRSVMEMVMSVFIAFFLISRLGFTGICLANPLSWFASGIPVYIALAFFALR
jgi:Na+-driven multidrug efflux pump